MSRKPSPPISYGDEVALPGIPRQDDIDDMAGEGKSGRRPILDKSAPTLVYIHPAAKHQLRQYAVSQGLKTKVHDLMIEALEEWGERRGLAGPWRVPPSKPRR
jgi:hypothetical protein